MPKKYKNKTKYNSKKKSKSADQHEAPNTDRILNCLPSPNQERDWGADQALAAGVLGYQAIPDALDLRDDWWGIGNQQETGSCVGWALADSVLRWHFVQEGDIALDAFLSPRFTWMAAKETDEFTSRPTAFIETSGTSLKAALDVSRDFGAVHDAELPFGSGDLYPYEERNFYAIAADLKIKRYFNIGTSPSDWRRWLAQNGPILTRLDVDDSFYDASHTGGVLDRYNHRHTYGGHAVALVGYDQDMFIVRNSWGCDWGDGGFAYATNDYAAAAFTEAYAVNTF